MLPHGHHYTADDIRAIRAELVALDPALAVTNAATPEFTWRHKPPGFEGLLHLITEQQVSVASAAAIWKRITSAMKDVTSTNVLTQGEEGMRGLGLSRPKARYATALAQAEHDGVIDFEKLATLDDTAAVAKLTSLLGVGRWTAEAFLIGAYGRTDFFPAADIALQEAVRVVDGAQRRPTEKELYARVERWKPHRAIAAHLLWTFYTTTKHM